MYSSFKYSKSDTVQHEKRILLYVDKPILKYCHTVFYIVGTAFSRILFCILGHPYCKLGPYYNRADVGNRCY